MNPKDKRCQDTIKEKQINNSAEKEISKHKAQENIKMIVI